MNPVERSPWFERFAHPLIELPSPEIAKIAQAAARHKVNVVVGVNERRRTGVGQLGSPARGQNTNTLAHFSLRAQGELVYVASCTNYPSPSPTATWWKIKVRAALHCFEAKVFTVVSCSTVSEEFIEAMAATHLHAHELLAGRNSPLSGFLEADGRESIVYADIDLSRCTGHARCTTSPVTTTASTRSTCG